MANAEHIAIAKQGAAVWNEWRRQTNDVPDLSGADLFKAHIGRANFAGMNLSDVDLGRAYLQGATFFMSDIRNANLHRTDLIEADLYQADLRGANLSGALLLRADLSRADLRGAHVSGAELNETVFGDTNLKDAQGLDLCFHLGPSTVDHRTLSKSGSLPLQFLRGCGLPDQFIEYVPSLFNQAIQFFSCFISYSTTDQAFAERLHADLQSKGVRCWFAPHDIKGGKKIHEQIDDAIRLYDRLLVILSEHSMNSHWVKTEIANARQKEKASRKRVLFPVALVSFDTVRAWKYFNADIGEDTAQEVREYYIPDFSDWKNHDRYQEAFERLLRDFKAEGQ